MTEIDLRPLGDRAWIARFGREDDARRWAAAVRGEGLAGVTDVVLAYRSASVHVGTDVDDLDTIEASLRGVRPIDDGRAGGRLIEIPVLYDGADLVEVADRVGLRVGEVVAAHAGVTYDVFAIGFRPGFPYLGYVPPPIDRVPRRAEPRTRVPAGSVAIAAGQTGIYPAELPGGWNLIGRTPMTIVDVDAGHFPIRAGDRVRFGAIDAAEFDRRRGEVLR